MSPKHPPADADASAEADLEAMAAALDALPPPWQALDPAAVDGLLAAVVLQPKTPAERDWLRLIVDADGRVPAAAPAPASMAAIAAIARRRAAGLRRAVAARQWFDPWLFDAGEDHDGDDSGDGDSDDHAGADHADADGLGPAPIVLPWIAGFALGFDTFTGLADQGGPGLVEPLALLYRHFDADDLDDADELLEAIDEIGPAESREDAVEGLVRAVLLLADVADAVRRTPRRPAPGRRR